MAKEDFCFTYYDGDAARDTTHMNRLERGAYHDLIISQRKFGHLTLDQVKKILGRDFAECWPAVELIMKVDADGKFFIEWLDVSISKMRAQSKHQSENGKKGGRPKAKQNPTESQSIPEQKPLEDGDGIGNESEDEKEIENNVRKSLKVPRATKRNEEQAEVIDFMRPDVEGECLIFPLDTKPVRDLWCAWKKYRWEKFNLRYGMMGEQADLKRLEGMTFQQIEQTILAAMAGGWKNIYPDQNRQNGKSNGTTGNKKQQHIDSVRQSVALHYAEKLGNSPSKSRGTGADG